MKIASMNLDPERRLWLPNRRSFFFFGVSAVVGAVLPAPPQMSMTEAVNRATQYRFDAWERPFRAPTEAEIIHLLEEVMRSGEPMYFPAHGVLIGTPSPAAASSRE